MLGTSAKGWTATEGINWAQQFEQKLAYFNGAEGLLVWGYA